jgi:thymidylate synthase (FAD)
MTTDADRLNRTRVPELEEMLGKKIAVLDDGFIRVIDYMGSDESIVQAARVSYGAGTKKVSQDRGLIRYLLRNRHTTPFEMCELKIHVRVPMDCWRQWIRHRTANVNEYSTRYSVAIDSMRATKPDEWRLQSEMNMQGSQGAIDPETGALLTQSETEFHQSCREVYEERLTKGIAREQARKDLPLGTYTEAYWKIDLHNLLHFLNLRMDSHAQYEIRQYAGIIGQQIVSKWVPLTWEAFKDYRANSMNLSQQEIRLIAILIKDDQGKALAEAKDMGWLLEKDGVWKPGREAREIIPKLELLGLNSPW